MDTDNRNMISDLFFSVAEKNFNLKTQTLEWFNNAFGMSMRNGIFRVITVRFDCFRQVQDSTDIISIMQEECIKILRANLEKFCYDILFANDFLFCRGLLSYAPGKEEQVRRALESSIVAIKEFPKVAASARVTLGLSLPYRELVDTNQAVKETKEAIWLRFSKGTGRVIEWEKDQVFPASYLKTLEYYKRKLKKACVLLDIDTFTKTIKEFFTLPKRILASMETRAFLYEIELYMYEVNREAISEFSDVALVHKAIRDAHKNATTLEEYLDCYTVHMSSLFEQIIKYVPKNSKLVRQAEYFVQENIAKGIRLSDVANQVGLNAVYFSHLFKKATGENFTDYVVGCRIDASKTYLTQEKNKLDAIAALTGFSDAKYFSKKFKEKEGISPSEYRKFHC